MKMYAVEIESKLVLLIFYWFLFANITFKLWEIVLSFVCQLICDYSIVHLMRIYTSKKRWKTKI